MLDWKRVDDSWFGNGFRVRRVAPKLWSLENAEVQGVIDVTGPIAELRTLEACKFKAESIHEAEQLGAHRRRLGAVGVAGWSLALIAGSPIGFIVGGVIGSAALLEWLATWLGDGVGGAQEYVQ